MIEPVASQHILLAAAAGALVILSGAAYALFFALGRLRAQPSLQWFALASYATLVAATLALAATLNLSGTWTSLVAVMLIGYLLAPHGIWWLCVGTHRPAEAESRSTRDA